jgi:hypothetical protein
MGIVPLFFVVFGGLVVLILLVSWLYGGDGSGVLDWDPSERIRQRLDSEHQEMRTMLAKHNERRREQNLPEHSEDEFTEEVLRERRAGGRPGL